MLDSLPAFQRILLFRLCTAVFVAAIQFFACLCGKLLKDHSRPWYNLFSSFCLGILLSESVGLTTSGRIYTSKLLVIFSDISFLLAFLSLIVIHSITSLSSKSYQALNSNANNLSIEDDGDLELQDYSSEANITPPPSVSLTPSATIELYSMWRQLSLIAFMTKILGDGVYIGATEHKSIDEYRIAACNGLFLSFVFGIICEETITQSALYLGNLMTFSSAMPVGILLGAGVLYLVPSWTELIHIATSSISSGMTTAIALCFMFHIDQMIAESTMTNTDDSSPKTKVLKAAFIAAGYILTTIQSTV